MNDSIINVRTPQHHYPIYIGDALGAEDYLAKCRHSSLHIVTDDNVYRLHGKKFEQALRKKKLKYHIHCVSPGESTKSLTGYQTLLDKILATHPDRDALIVAWGGGVVGDLAGFAAATLLRGVALVQIPTTLLAQVDSSVGGKTGINMAAGKNLAGAFYQPQMVIISCDSLKTLPVREMRAGYAEIVKYGLINDAAFFGWLADHGHRILSHDSEAVRYAVSTSCRAKAAIVTQDAHEATVRALLNLGHSFAHALEALTGYDSDALLHGEAVAIGIGLAFHFAEHAKICEKGAAKIVCEHFESVGLNTNPYHLPIALDAKILCDAMLGDKKNRGGKLTLVLPEKIGTAIIVPGFTPKQVENRLTKILKRYPQS